MIQPIYVTGGIATGKSTCARRLRKSLGKRCSRVEWFDADESVHEILTRPPIVTRICQLFGDDVLGPDGQLDRPVLRTRVFADPSLREQLESLLHPEVYLDLVKQIKEASQGDAVGFLIAEIPLYYESNHPSESSTSTNAVAQSEGRKSPPGLEVVVACSEDLQRRRLKARGWSEQDADRAIQSQLPVGQKITWGDRLVWTAVSVSSTFRQIERLSESLLAQSHVSPELG